MALEIAVILKPNMSLAAIVVVVKSVRTVLLIAVPEDIDTPFVLIEFPTVGTAVPLATFHVFTVHVPVSTKMVHALIVAAKGQEMYSVEPFAIGLLLPSKTAIIAELALFPPVVSTKSL